MTREEAQKLWPILKAYSMGKEIEIYSAEKDMWLPCPCPGFVENCRYRIKPAPAECWAVVNCEGRTVTTFDSDQRDVAERYAARNNCRVIRMVEA